MKCQSRLWSQRGTKVHIMVTTRYSDQQESKSRQKVMWLYKQWHRTISKRFIKSPYSISRATSTCCILFTLLTDRASTIPSNIRGCQSGTWSQRGTKVNGSHHGDNPLLRPTGIQIATKRLRLNKYKHLHRPISKRLHIEGRTLVVGRRQQSESIEAALDME